MHGATHTPTHSQIKMWKRNITPKFAASWRYDYAHAVFYRKRYAKQKFYTQEIIKGSQVLRYSSHQNKSLHPMVGYLNSQFIAIQ